ncbi:MAG: alanine racemase [Candidatus Krumholzibacteriota bacterium]|nr:alanine racemase [Candidatus Krumholzibacteriota bacterium]
MNRIRINLEAMRQNLIAANELMLAQGATWTVVTKVLCGHVETLRALVLSGVKSIGESRFRNLQSFKEYVPDLETWYLRIPSMSAIKEVINFSEVSLNSEYEIIMKLNKEARRQEKLHHIVIMIELGDLREGILPGSLVKFYKKIFHLSNINVIGIGANLGCLVGAIPTIDQFMQLKLYKELLELKFDRKLPLISAGTTATLPLVIEKRLPRGINHFRIGEGVFLGNDLINGGTLPDFRNDIVVLEAEVIEIKKKSLASTGETGSLAPFEIESEEDYEVGQRGYRALVNVGQLDTNVNGLTPVNESYKIAGASSDITVVNVGDNPSDLKVGGYIKFKLNYAALLRLMNSEYVKKVVEPSLEGFEYRIKGEKALNMPVSLSNENSDINVGK